MYLPENENARLRAGTLTYDIRHSAGSAAASM